MQPASSLDGAAYEPSVDAKMGNGLSHSLSEIQSVRCITADRTFSHASTSVEGPLLEILTRIRYQGLYKIQVGFNDEMLKEGLQVEEIYLTLDEDLGVRSGSAVCSLLEPIFAPFPGIVSTPSQVYYIPIDNLSQAMSLSKDLQPTTRGSLNGRNKGSEKKGEGSGGGKDHGGWDDDEDWGNEGGGGDAGHGGDGDDPDSGGGGDGRGKTNRREGPRILNIRGFGSTMTIKGPKGSHQLKVTGGLDIIVSNNSASECSLDTYPWSNVGGSELQGEIPTSRFAIYWPLV